MRLLALMDNICIFLHNASSFSRIESIYVHSKEHSLNSFRCQYFPNIEYLGEWIRFLPTFVIASGILCVTALQTLNSNVYKIDRQH